MAKDYAKKRQGRNQGNLVQQVLLLCVVFITGYLTASVFDLDSLNNWLNHRFNETPPSAPSPSAPVASTPKPKFEFYTLLSKDTKRPTLPARPTPTPVSAHAPPITSAPPSTDLPKVVENTGASKSSYLIQVAAFNKKEEAEKLKASLVLRGFDVKVNARMQGNTTWYRVVIGPFINLAEAEKVQFNIARNDHIRGMIRKE